MKKILTSSEAYSKAAALCSRAEHSSADIRKKLINWGIESSELSRIVDKLQDEKFIDDDRYCRAYIRDKFLYSRWGRKKIAQYLMMTGIKTNFEPYLFTEIDEKEYKDCLLQILISKNRTTKAASSYERYAKLMRFAISRGFETELSKTLVNTIVKNEDE